MNRWPVTASLWSYRWIPLEESPHRRAYHGLAQRVTRRLSTPRPPLPRAPFGWCYVRELDRDSAYLIPLWMKPVVTWPRWRWAFCELLVRLGLWSLKEEGGYYRDGQWCWRWWHGFDREMAQIDRATANGGGTQFWSPREHTTNPKWPFSPWFRLGWWIEDHTRHLHMPPTFSEL